MSKRCKNIFHLVEKNRDTGGFAIQHRAVGLNYLAGYFRFLRI